MIPAYTEPEKLFSGEEEDFCNATIEIQDIYAQTDQKEMFNHIIKYLNGKCSKVIIKGF